jgi:hypothetical protein
VESPVRSQDWGSPERLKFIAGELCGIWPEGITRCWEAEKDTYTLKLRQDVDSRIEFEIRDWCRVHNGGDRPDFAWFCDESLLNRYRPKQILTMLEQFCLIDGEDNLLCWYRTGDPPSFGSAAKPHGQLKDVRTIVGNRSSKSCALRNDGSLWCWSSDSRFAGATRSSTKFARVQRIDNVTEVAIGSGHLCAIREDGSLFCWGENYFGQIGTGIGEDGMPGGDVPEPGDAPEFLRRPTRTAIPLPVNSVFTSDDATCAATVEGVYCFGASDGGLIPGVREIGTGKPHKVSGIGSIRQFVMEGVAACVLETSGVTYCWGIDAPNSKRNDDAPQPLHWIEKVPATPGD